MASLDKTTPESLNKANNVKFNDIDAATLTTTGDATINGDPHLQTRGADPSTSDLSDGECTFYVSDGSADVTGADGDVISAVNNAGTIKATIIADYSAL